MTFHQMGSQQRKLVNKDEKKVATLKVKGEASMNKVIEEIRFTVTGQGGVGKMASDEGSQKIQTFSYK